ncbi:MAG: hypothetical protein P1V97_14065 [Planctomycetota bacterium]|nr:hypothetical protein [Planctomycetota bacterium]
MTRDRERQNSRKDLGKARRASRRSSVPEEPESTAGKTGFSEDGQYFFGPSPTKKREMRRTKDDRPGIDPIKDLDLNAAPRRAPKQVGKNVRLIDLAMDDQQFRPPASEKSAENSSGSMPKLPPFKKVNRGPAGSGPAGSGPAGSGSAVPRETRAFAGRKSGRRFSNVVGKGAVKTRSLPGAAKALSAPPTPKPGPAGPKSKQVTRPPRRSESETARSSQVRKGPAPTRPRPGPSGKGPAPSARPGPRPGSRPGPGPRSSGASPAPGSRGVRPKGIQRPPRPTGQRRRPQ